MDATTRANVKRAVMTLVPGITPPVIDFAINNIWLASISTTASVGAVPTNKAPARSRGYAGIRSRDTTPPCTFTLKKMDSGDWGELSLANPLQRKYKAPNFNDPKNLEFKIDDICE